MRQFALAAAAILLNPRVTRLRKNAVQKARSSEGPTATPRTCRSPSTVTPIATTVAWLVT
jgi:hypothetical protein